MSVRKEYKQGGGEMSVCSGVFDKRALYLSVSRLALKMMRENEKLNVFTVRRKLSFARFD